MFFLNSIAKLMWKSDWLEWIDCSWFDLIERVVKGFFSALLGAAGGEY